MARFALSPYANPVQAGLDSFGSALNNIGKLQDIADAPQRRADQQQETQQRIRMNDLSIQGAEVKQQDQEREEKKKVEADEIDHLSQPLHAYRMKLAQAKMAGQPLPEPDADAVAAGLAVQKMHDGGTIHDAMPKYHSYLELQRTAPVVQQAIAGAIQGGQKQGRIDHPEFIQNVNGAKLFDQPVTSVLFDASDPNNVTFTPVGRQKPDKGQWSKREDGSEKGNGFLGLLKRPDGKISSEISIGVNMGGKETEIPTMVPTLSKEEVNYLLTNPVDEKLFKSEQGQAIKQKAVAFAQQRIAEGKSPFASNDESPSAPLKDKKGNIIKIPADEITGQMHDMAGAGTMLLGIGSYLDSIKDPNKLAEFEAKADEMVKTRDQRGAMKKAYENTSPGEQIKAYIKEMTDKGHIVSAKEAKLIFDPPKDAEELKKLEIDAKKDAAKLKAETDSKLEDKKTKSAKEVAGIHAGATVEAAKIKRKELSGSHQKDYDDLYKNLVKGGKKPGEAAKRAHAAYPEAKEVDGNKPSGSTTLSDADQVEAARKLLH